MVLYIDCQNRKTFVTELYRSNKVIGEEEQNIKVDKEVDIDIVEELFDNDFFERQLNGGTKN